MEKKKMKWSDIERIYKAFIELKEALYRAPYFAIIDNKRRNNDA